MWFQQSLAKLPMEMVLRIPGMELFTLLGKWRVEKDFSFPEHCLAPCLGLQKERRDHGVSRGTGCDSGLLSVFSTCSNC